MSKLDELIKELCPGGVEYKTLGELCEIGKGIQFNKSDMQDKGTYPVINGGINPSGYIEQYNQTENTITISQGGASAGYVNWIESKFWAGAHCYVLKPNGEFIINRYAFHFLKSQEYKLQECQYGAGIPALAKSTIAELKIPVPPLPVQEEIVRILDTFTQLTAELTAELTARRAQYEYYRDALLTFDKLNGGGYKEFFSVCDYVRGITYNKSDEINNGKDGIKVLRANNITLETNTLNYDDIKIVSSEVKIKERQRLKKDDILICAGSGSKEHIGKVAYIFDDMEYTFGGFMGVIRPSSKELKSRFLFHILTSSIFKKHLAKVSGATSSTINNINSDTWKGFMLPLPPLDVQERLVRVLDNFDAICSDLKIGLPAEIEARKKQYEFYRDSLLTFAETGRIAADNGGGITMT